MAEWQNAQLVSASLVEDGWKSPDTYRNCFHPVCEDAAIYLFLLHNRETYSEAVVAYVGMSTNLGQRLSSHNILPLLHETGHWPMRWFKRASETDLRDMERDYIKRFDPPWNIIGRTRGVLPNG